MWLFTRGYQFIRPLITPGDLGDLYHDRPASEPLAESPRVLGPPVVQASGTKGLEIHHFATRKTTMFLILIGKKTRTQ